MSSSYRGEQIMLKTRTMIAHVILAILLFFEGLSKRESCRHKVLYVDEITQDSAVLYWKSEREGESKVVCAGIRQYVTPLGTREVDLDTVTQFLPRAVDRAFLNHLKPNFNYTCLVLAKEKTRPLLFSTQYDAPESPEKPVVLYENDGKQIDIQLFPTSTRYGPIDGYEVQFHIIDAHTLHSHGQLDLPEEITRPRGLLATVEAAHSSTHPVPFCLVFRNSSLPASITVSRGPLQGAVRSGSTYSVITVAYTEEAEGPGQILLYSLSPPSDAFSIPEELQSPAVSGTLVWLERHLLKWSMSVGVVSSNIILFYFLLVGCCVAPFCRRKWRRRKNMSLANPEDERSFGVKEDEPPSATIATVSNNAVCFTEQSHGGPGVEVPACSSEREEMTMYMATKGSVAGEIPTPHASDQQGEPPTESSTNPRSSRGQCSSGGEEPGTKGFGRVMSRGSEPLVPHGSSVGIVQLVEQSAEASGSSLVFVPRGLSLGPLSQVTSTGADMAPDLEMDLYGISYSLDDN